MTSSKPPTIDKLFRIAADQLKNDFESTRKSVPHYPTSGGAVEEILRKFLNDHLPRRFSATAGFVIDIENQISQQSDVLIYDAENSPVYNVSNKNLILPADSIASVIEVKSTLSKKELKDAVTKVASVKKLKRSSITNIDQPVTFSELIVNSTFGIVFAYDSKTSLNTLASNLRELNAELPSSQWTDLVVVLGKGVLGYYIQYPGEESLLGQLMPPANERFVKFPYYVNLSISEDPQYTVNRFFATLMAQLTFFRKRSSIPLDPMLQGATNNVKRVQEYWLNSKGKLKEVPNSHCGEGPEPNWSFNVFVANTQHILGRISQHTWADGYIYQVTPTSYEAIRLLGYIAKLNQKDPVHIFPSKDKLKGLTSILSGIPPTSEQIKKHIINFSNGNIEVR